MYMLRHRLEKRGTHKHKHTHTHVCCRMADKCNHVHVCRFFGHKPQHTGHVEAVFSVNYLNNSTSNWDTLLEPWPVVLLLSNPVNRIFKDNRTT